MLVMPVMLAMLAMPGTRGNDRSNGVWDATETWSCLHIHIANSDSASDPECLDVNVPQVIYA